MAPVPDPVITHRGHGNRYQAPQRVERLLSDGRARLAREIVAELPMLSYGSVTQALIRLQALGRVERIGDRKPHRFRIR